MSRLDARGIRSQEEVTKAQNRLHRCWLVKSTISERSIREDESET
jgi:hypothetical protein